MNSYHYGIITKWDDYGVNERQYLLTLDTAKKVVIYVGNGSGYDAVGADVACVTGQWQHIAGTYSGTNLCVYLNGVLRNSKSTTQAMTARSVDLKIVDNQVAGSGGRFFNGIVDQAHVFNRALSSNEIYNLYLYNGTNFATAGMEIECPATLKDDADFEGGIGYVQPLGDLGMGAHTNRP